MRTFLCSLMAVFCLTAYGQLNIPSDGSDGALNVTSDVTIDLSLAVDGTWSDTGDGNGIYDAEQWAVVFKYSSINIQSNDDVRFINHPSGAPVIWLCQGDVTIDGYIYVSGSTGHHGSNAHIHARPGPGGFRGGLGGIGEQDVDPSGGHGPGGGKPAGNGGGGGGSYGTLGIADGGTVGPVYGNAGVFPLIGGSGGSGGGYSSGSGGGGGAGGGAILIATPGNFSLEGYIYAIGGNGGSSYGAAGSGGAIRLIADSIGGNGYLYAYGGNGSSGGTGGDGRIYIEANENTLGRLGDPIFTYVDPSDDPQIFRDTSTPEVYITSVNGEALPADPASDLTYPNQDLQLLSAGTYPVALETTNVPTGSTVSIRLVNTAGDTVDTPASFVGGNETMATWTANVAFLEGFKTIQAHAVFPSE